MLCVQYVFKHSFFTHGPFCATDGERTAYEQVRGLRRERATYLPGSPRHVDVDR